MKNENKYKKVYVQTSSQLSMIIMLYERIIQDLEFAKELFSKNETLKASEKAIHAQKIILELIATINFEQGKEVAFNLHRIYSFLNKELNDIIIDKKYEKIDPIIENVAKLLDSWKELNKNPTLKNFSPPKGINIVS